MSEVKKTRNLTPEEKRAWILENCIDKKGDVDLTCLDFSDFDGCIFIREMKVQGDLWQDCQDVQGDLFQDTQEVGQSLYQNNQTVKNYVYQYRIKAKNVIQDKIGE